MTRTGTRTNEPRMATPSRTAPPSASAATPTATTAIASAPRVQRSAIPPPASGDSAPIGSRVGGRLPRTRVPVLRVGSPCSYPPPARRPGAFGTHGPPRPLPGPRTADDPGPTLLPRVGMGRSGQHELGTDKRWKDFTIRKLLRPASPPINSYSIRPGNEPTLEWISCQVPLKNVTTHTEPLSDPVAQHQEVFSERIEHGQVVSLLPVGMLGTHVYIATTLLPALDIITPDGDRLHVIEDDSKSILEMKLTSIVEMRPTIVMILNEVAELFQGDTAYDSTLGRPGMSRA